jgi:secondary thiamine-phosphate synthase enzyme
MLKEFFVKTHQRYELIDITSEVEKIVGESGTEEGIALVFVPHSTAGILLTENESGLKEDWLAVFKKLVSEIDFKHNRIDDNADSHILSGLIGQGKTLAIKNKNLLRGTWQQIFLAEFDGPRERKVLVKVVS